MKQLLITTIAAGVLTGFATTQQSTPAPEPLTGDAPNTSILKAAKEGNIEAVKQHLAAGTDSNAKLDYVGTPLHAAAIRGHKEITELLIAKGADVNAKSDDRRTPLHQAANNGHKEIAELLIAEGADVNAKTDDGETPLDVTFHRKRTTTADLLRKHEAKTGEELKAATKPNASQEQ